MLNRRWLVMLYDNAQGLLRVIIVTVLAYSAMILILRFAGKRALAKLNAFDLIVTVALGSTLATVLLTKDVALAEGLVAFIMLAMLQWIVSRASISSPWFRNLVRAEPKLLFENGKYRASAMAEERVTSGEIQAAVRTAGIGSMATVAAVVLETDGTMSVIKPEAGADLTALESVRR